MPVWDLYQLDYGHMHAGQRWSALDNPEGNRKKKRKHSELPIKTTDDLSRTRILIYLQVIKETSQIEASRLCVPVLVRTDVLKASIGKYSIVIF